MNEIVANHLYRWLARLRGERTFDYLEEYNASQWFRDSDFEKLREKRLGGLVSHTLAHIPYYREMGIKTFDEFPVLTRGRLMEAGAKLMNPSKRNGLSCKVTAGSTGQPVRVFKDGEALAREQAITLRGYGWAGVLPGSRQGRFWGVGLSPKVRWINQAKDLALNRKRFPAFNYTEEVLEKYAQEMLRFRPTFLYGYASMLDDIARYLLLRGNTRFWPGLKAVVTTSEVLTAEARERIETAFGVGVFNEYGCSEIGTIAHECEKGRLHVNGENIHVEILDEEGRIAPVGTGKVLVTELHNKVQPLIRYDLGDYGTISSRRCECGRSLPVLEEVHGKSYDILIGPGGRKYFPEFFAYIFKEIQGKGEKISQFQVIQDKCEITANIVKGADFTPDVEERFRFFMNREFGDFFLCKFQYVDGIAKEKSGKLRQVKRVAAPEDVSAEPVLPGKAL